MVTLESTGVDKLSTDDQVVLAHLILEKIEHDRPRAPLSCAMKAFLQARLDSATNNPDDLVDWSVVKEEALARCGP